MGNSQPHETMSQKAETSASSLIPACPAATRCTICCSAALQHAALYAVATLLPCPSAGQPHDSEHAATELPAVSYLCMLALLPGFPTHPHSLHAVCCTHAAGNDASKSYPEEVPAPSEQWVKTDANGQRSWVLYDPTGETDKFWPQPRYGELRDFAAVPRPGMPAPDVNDVVDFSWQTYIPQEVLLQYVPKEVLQMYLPLSTYQGVTQPAGSAAVPRPDWPSLLPTTVIQHFMPVREVRKYIPQGTALNTPRQFKDGLPMGSILTGAVPNPNQPPNWQSWAQQAGAPSNWQQFAPQQSSRSSWFPSGSGGGAPSTPNWFSPSQMGSWGSAIPSRPGTPTGTRPPTGTSIMRPSTGTGVVRRPAPSPSPKPKAPAPRTPAPARSPAPKVPAPAPTKPSTGSSAPTGLSKDLQAALDATNVYRRRHGSPPVVWDAQIAANAANFAVGCPRGHSGASGVGENMAWGYDNFKAAVDAWYNEVSSAVAGFALIRMHSLAVSLQHNMHSHQYMICTEATTTFRMLPASDCTAPPPVDWSTRPQVSQYNYNNPGFSGATGHFTQLVWSSTRRMGCARADACSWRTFVCQYAPPGKHGIASFHAGCMRSLGVQECVFGRWPLKRAACAHAQPSVAFYSCRMFACGCHDQQLIHALLLVTAVTVLLHTEPAAAGWGSFRL
jgi:hypothetical protein